MEDVLKTETNQAAAGYVLNFTPTGVITEDRLKCFIAGAEWMRVQAECANLEKVMRNATIQALRWVMSSKPNDEEIKFEISKQQKQLEL